MSSKPAIQRPSRQSASSSRSARLEARITRAQKDLIERAAAYSGRSVTDFVVAALASTAESVVLEHESIALNRVQSRQFVEALLSPPRPNRALRNAVRKHRRSRPSR